MITKTMLLVAVSTLLVVCACTKRAPALPTDLQIKDSAASVTADAAKFLHQLHEQGELPGLSKADHGELKASVSDFSEKVRFPVALEFRFRKSNDSIYHYSVSRLSTNSDWQVTRAWQTDAGDKTIRELPVQQLSPTNNPIQPTPQ